MGPVINFRALGSSLLDRLQWMKQAGLSFKGARDLYEVLGYDRVITFRQYRDRYSRGGIAGRIVDALPNATWRGDMELIEDENPETFTTFEQSWDDLNTRLKINAVMSRADKLSRLSTYAIILIGAPGNLDEPLPNGTPDQLMYLMPFTGGGGPGYTRHGNDNYADADATIKRFETDAKNARFGLPVEYQLRRTDLSSPALQVPVHWSRVAHIAENVLDNDVYGLPALERVWNLLDDLDKVTGGGSEAFWLRANQGMHLDIDKDMALDAAKEQVEDLKKQAEEYKHQMTRWMRTRGVTIDTMSSDVANFLGPADAILTQIAGSCAMPKRILTGSEMGELASSQDRDNWKDQINGRQTGYAGPYIVRPLVDRLIEYGYLPTPTQYDVRWPHIQVMTEAEKAEGAAKWASINATSGMTVFSKADIRDKWYQMDEGEDSDTDTYKAAGAEKMAMTNKTQGATIFTDDEIRKTWYDWAPLSPEQKVPITAPERVSATAPTPPDDQVGGKGTPPPGAGGKGTPPPGGKVLPFKAAETEMLRVLASAVETNNVEVIDAILGIDHLRALDKDEHGYGSYKRGEGPGPRGDFGLGFEPQKEYIRLYQASQGANVLARPSASQAKKLHAAFSSLETLLRDPEIGMALYHELGAVTPSQMHDRLVELEHGIARIPGGASPPPIIGVGPNAYPSYVKAASEASVIHQLITMLEDPDTGDAVAWLLSEISKAGGPDQFKASLKTASSQEFETLVDTLEMAIVNKDTKTLDELLGVAHA